MEIINMLSLEQSNLEKYLGKEVILMERASAPNVDSLDRSLRQIKTTLKGVYATKQQTRMYAVGIKCEDGQEKNIRWLYHGPTDIVAVRADDQILWVVPSKSKVPLKQYAPQLSDLVEIVPKAYL